MNINYNVYQNFLLSKYPFISKNSFTKHKVFIDLESKFVFKHIDDVLLVFWLLFITNNAVNTPKVRFSKFNKRVVFFKLKNVSIEFISSFTYFFLYNKQFSVVNKKKLTSIDSLDILFFNNFLNKKKILGSRPFFGTFKQDNVEHVFSSLGVSGLKLGFNFILRSNSTISTYNKKLLLDLVYFSDFSIKLKDCILTEEEIY